MRNTATLSLFGTGFGKNRLFGNDVLERYLNEHKTTPIPTQDEYIHTISEWVKSLASTKATEISLEHKFAAEIFCNVLGYTLYPTPEGVIASLFQKPPTTLTRIKGTPDVILGQFTASDAQFDAVVELKTPGTDLDKPQTSYQNNRTPVEQGFFYAEQLLGVRWIIISDMQYLRLYSVESQSEYIEVNLKECVNDANSSVDKFRRMYFLFHHRYLIQQREKSQINLLYAKSSARQLEIRDSFYQAYYRIRSRLYKAIKKSCSSLASNPTRVELLEATQRLLDRLLFIFYCEDHPQQLIKNGTIEGVIKAARTLPGSSNHKIYDYLKLFFEEVDSGSPASSGSKVNGYNGELFKNHPILDHIELPDELSEEVFLLNESDGRHRRINGVWGLHVYDFWTELNEHLLGHIFEESLSDLKDLDAEEEVSISEKLKERKRDGIFYTNSLLSDFLSSSALQSILDGDTPLAGNSPEEYTSSLNSRLNRLSNLKVIDLACGSGAFLVSMYAEMLQEYWRIRAALNKLALISGAAPFDLFSFAASVDQASLLRECIFGVDKLPQAVEIAKLSLWLRSARKDEKVPDLSRNVIAADSLDASSIFTKLAMNAGSFDLVIGNPPWGGQLAPGSHQQILASLDLPYEGNWDTWELFLALAMKALKVGGRLALVLPDSFFYPEKAKIRRLLFQSTTVEKIHYLGPDWFGKKVRVGTVIIQARRGQSNSNSDILCALLSGKLRERTIRGEVPLKQIEAQRSRLIPVARVLNSPNYEVEVFRGAKDDDLMGRMEGNGLPLQALCERARGEEINKAGLLWECPSCLTPTPPGTKKKGSGYNAKKCAHCGHELTEKNVNTLNLVESSVMTVTSSTMFIDGTDISRRYQIITPQKRLRLNVTGWDYKPDNIYNPPKILVRQAGIGLFATLDATSARCPQSVYIYRLKESRQTEGYEHEYVLAALLSRTMAYFVFKRFGEVDPAKAHAKMTHERLANLPIPTVDFSSSKQKKAHDMIVANVRQLLSGSSSLGGQEDRAIEQLLRELWGIDQADGAYINGEFYDLPESQEIRDLFPQGRPKPVVMND